MNLRGAAEDLDQIFTIILLAILILNTLMYLFVFILNWEAYFFGMKLDGPDAGILLFAYFIIPAVLAALLLIYPRKIVIIALLSIFFFGFKFIDSATTIQAISGGANSFSGFLAATVVIPLVVLTGHIIVSQFYDREEDNMEEGPGNRAISGIPGIEERDKKLVIQILALAITAAAVVFMFGPAVIMPGIILLLLFLVLLALKKRYDAKKSGREIKEEITGGELLLIIATILILFLLVFVVRPLLFLQVTR